MLIRFISSLFKVQPASPDMVHAAFAGHSNVYTSVAKAACWPSIAKVWKAVTDRRGSPRARECFPAKIRHRQALEKKGLALRGDHRSRPNNPRNIPWMAGRCSAYVEFGSDGGSDPAPFIGCRMRES